MKSIKPLVPEELTRLALDEPAAAREIRALRRALDGMRLGDFRAGCWCGGAAIIKRHLPCCLAARRARGISK